MQKMQKTVKHDNSKNTMASATGNMPETASIPYGMNASSQSVNAYKQKMCALNPLHNAQKMQAGTDGSNNPNIEGQDNGHNAWMDAQLNAEEIDEDMKYDIRYAKQNSETNRFFDIDDVPIRGPPKIHDVDLDASLEDVTEIANRLINEENISICRNTGIMRAVKTNNQDRHKRENHASSHRETQKDEHAENKQSRYKSHCKWDTDIKYEPESRSSDNMIGTGAKAKNSNTAYYRSPNRYVSKHDKCGRHTTSERVRSEVRMQQSEHRRERQDNARHIEQLRYLQRDSRRHEGYKGRRDYSSSSTDSSPDRRYRSGISAKSNSCVRDQLCYPHFSLGQMSGFIGQNIQFHQLSYEQFIAGELTTISLCSDPDEIRGRTELLQHISLWKLRANMAWPQVRNAYAHIIRKIENREINWFSEWDRFERHIYDKIVTTTNSKIEKKVKSNNGPIESVWYCKNYQKS